MAVKFGLIGSGRIGAVMVRAMHAGTCAVPYAVASRNKDHAREFAEQNRVGKATDFDALLADPEIEAVYVCLPHVGHYEWTVRALQAGKHVLCEKPLALSAAAAREMYDLAADRKLLLMEGYMYRFHPQTARLVALVEAGTIGQVHTIRCAFGFQAAIASEGRLFNPGLAGGAIWDIGGYPVSMTSLLGGRIVDSRGIGRFLDNGVDLAWSGTVLTERGVMGQILCACDRTITPTLSIYGDGGSITVPDPWVCNREHSEDGRIMIEVSGRKDELIVPADHTSFQYELEAFCSLLRQGCCEAANPGVNYAESLNIIATLKAMRGDREY